MVPDTLILRKKLVIGMLVLVGLTAALLLSLTHANAFGEDLAHTMMTDIVNYLSQNEMKDAADIMLGRSSGYYDAAVNGIGKTVSGSLKGIGYILIVIYFVQSLLREIQRGRNDWDMIASLLLQVVIAAVVIFYSDEIIDGIEDAGKWMIDLISGTTLDASYQKVQDATGSLPLEQNDSLLKKVADAVAGLWKGLGMLSGLLIPWIGMKTLEITIKLTSYGLFFELAIRRAFMPIALANVYSGGLRSPGVRYLKKFFALFMKMMLVLLVLDIAWTMVLTSVEDNCGGNLWTLFADANFGSAGAAVSQGGTSVTIFDMFCILGASRAIMQRGAMYVDQVLGTVGRG